MERRQLGAALSALALVGQLLGCAGVPLPERPVHYLCVDEIDPGYYRDRATAIDYPLTTEPEPAADLFAEPILRLQGNERREVRDLTLGEALHVALSNSDVIRDQGQFLNPNATIYRNPEGMPTIYDPALQATGVLFGNRGVEAALSDFDAQLTTNLLWSRNEQIQNNRFTSGGLEPGETLAEEGAQFVTRLEKQLATGAQLSLQHDVNYSGNNVPTRLFPSVYTGSVRTEFRQPLLAGKGPEYTRVAGPISRAIRGVVGVNEGVVIARINEDIEIADFEANVRNLLKDVEDAYWSLALAYRTWDAEVTNRNAALELWQRQNVLVPDLAGAADEALAREGYYDARVRTETALAELYSAEGRLRRLMGLPPGDGTILRPLDEPTTARFLPDWQTSLAEALTHRVELRRQKWWIKRLELQVIAARNVARPRFDFVTSYQVNMFGDDLFADGDDDGRTEQGLASAYETLTQGDQTGWTAGFELSLPLGLRLARTQVRNNELQLMKARAVLAAQEFEVSHELAEAIRRLHRAYRTAQTNFNRREATRNRVLATRALFEEGGGVGGGGQQVTVDLFLRTLSAQAAAEVAYYRSLVEYNQALAELHFRKGTLLMENNVHLAEGGWDPVAYEKALRRAWDRTAGIPCEACLDTEPDAFAAGEAGWEYLGFPAGPTPPGEPGTPASAPDQHWHAAPAPAPDEFLAPLPAVVEPLTPIIPAAPEDAAETAPFELPVVPAPAEPAAPLSAPPPAPAAPSGPVGRARLTVP